MLLVIFVNTIFHLNSLNITVSVCYVSGSKVNRKEKSRPSLFVLCSTLPNISVSEHSVSSCQCPFSSPEPVGSWSRGQKTRGSGRSPYRMSENF